MEYYKIIVERTEKGWAASCPVFGIAVDAPDGSDLDAAVAAVKSLMAQEAARRLDAGDFLPASEHIDPEDVSAAGRVVTYVETDFTAQFVARTSETVRRNISMPAWMDLRLRRNNVDASKLFQDAAEARLAAIEMTGRGLRKIGTVQELQDMCVAGLLDIYFSDRVESMLKDDLKKGGH